MRFRSTRRLAAALVLLAASPGLSWVRAAPAEAGAVPHHEVAVVLEPAGHLIRVVDRVTLPPDAIGPDGAVGFSLHAALHLTEAGPGTVDREEAAAANAADVPVARYVAHLPEGARTLALAYEGILADPSPDLGGGTPGLIDREGALLSGPTHWYPQFDAADGLVSFRLTARLPKGWDAVSQGARASKATEADHTVVAWREDSPQDQIYLVAGPFTTYVQPGGPTEAMVFLRRPDRPLADRYLTATERYVALYARLLGAYPYAKFALVENRWETGFGMPSFTLMGPTVIRLPFIPDTSYPHEILHSWWGNGVFMKAEGGNWAEGLTVYLADHLLAERDGLGATYRRETLQRYGDFVRTGSDFPLTGFVARTGPVTQAVGYGKAMMLFHMLRRRLGDDAFLRALQSFYLAHRYARAGWDDLAAAFSDAGAGDVRPFMTAWLTRTGAPALALEGARAEALEDGGFRLTATLRQTQEEAPFPVDVPLAITLAGTDAALLRTVPMTGASAPVALDLPAHPARVDVDPDFDLFRRLAPGEEPPALSGLLGAEHALFVLPARAPDALLYAYGRLAAAWGSEGAATVLDNELTALPADGTAVWVLGRENAFARTAAAAVGGLGDLVLTDDAVVLSEGAYPLADHTLVFAATTPGEDPNASGPIGWIVTERPGALPGLARKLPHYAKYGYLAFEGDGPDNVLKRQWPPGESALAVPVPRADGALPAVAPGTLPLRPSFWP